MESLLNHSAGAAHRDWFGAQAAASFLGLHRSTVYLAVQRKQLIPDHFTPKGHARFRLETLEQFREHIVGAAATSDAPLFAPVKTLSDLAHAVNGVAPAPSPTKLARNEQVAKAVKDVCDSAVKAIRAAPLSIPNCCIALRAFDPRDPTGLRLAASEGFTPNFMRDYEWLRHQPTITFATHAALETHEPQFCVDAKEPQVMRNGTTQLLKAHGLRSFAIFPIMGGPVALGILLLASPEPRHFQPHEITFLLGVAEQVATAVTSHTRAVRLRDYAEACRDLTQLGLAQRARLTARNATATELHAEKRAAIIQLLTIVLRCADADGVCALGFDGGAIADASPELAALTQQALSADTTADGVCHVTGGRVGAGDYYTDDWRAHGVAYNGLAIGVPLGADQRAAVGAMWRRPTAWSDEDHLLLVTLAGACAMVSEAA